MRNRMIPFNRGERAALLVGMILTIAFVVAATPILGPPDFTAKSITAESLTIKAPGSDSSVSIQATRYATGVWVNSGNGTESVGLVVQPGVEPYFVVHGKDASATGLSFRDVVRTARQSNR